MKINYPDRGLHVIAVSGGMDSMVLLDLLSKKRGLELVVAHFNHGIRQDTAKDEELVAKAAKKLGLVLDVGCGKLGAGASEEQARKARYNFLEEVRKKHKAKTIITAHHQDDLIETAIINILRGTGRRGLSAIKDNPRVLRPLIDVPKTEILTYARNHQLRWLDDSTNQNLKYLRNYVRLKLVPKITVTERRNLIRNIDKVANNKVELDRLIATLSHSIINDNEIDRSKFAVLPPKMANELITFWLREHNLEQFDRKTVERLGVGLKTARANSELVAGKNLRLIISTTSAHFSNR